MPKSVVFLDQHRLRVGSCEFHCEHPIGDVPAGRMPVEKRRALVEEYVALCDMTHPRRIIELGVYKGGSTVLLNELADPEKLVAIDVAPGPVPLLAGYIDERGLGTVVRPYFGVDQSDRAQLSAIVRDEFPGEAPDLVIDDASHLYAQTRASFETLFPLIRPGGLFILEDWRWQHKLAQAATTAPRLSERARIAIARRMVDLAEGRAEKEVPLSRLVLELVLVRASSGDAISDVVVGDHWTSVHRGDAPLDGERFRIDDFIHDHFDLLRPLS
jgi:predicted O-methyltransferase YrrM